MSDIIIAGSYQAAEDLAARTASTSWIYPTSPADLAMADPDVDKLIMVGNWWDRKEWPALQTALKARGFIPL